MTADDLAWLQSRCVLIVDPDDTVRDAICKLLEPHGCRVVTAHDGTRAMAQVDESLRQTPPDLVITEIGLPDMRGRELAAKLRETLGPVPVVLMTGFGYDPQCIVRPSPPCELLYKPFRQKDLSRALQAVLAPGATASNHHPDSSTPETHAP